MNYQCATLAEYVGLWLEFHDKALNAEIVQHRDTCPTCTALREATIERREARERADSLAREISEQPQEEPTAESAELLRDVSEPILPGEGEDRRDGASDRDASGWADWGFRVDSDAGVMAGATAGKEII